MKRERFLDRQNEILAIGLLHLQITEHDEREYAEMMRTTMQNNIKLFKTDVSTLLCQVHKLDLSMSNTTHCDISYLNISAEFLKDGKDDTLRFYRDFVLLVYLKVALENTLEVFTTLKDIEVRERFDWLYFNKFLLVFIVVFLIITCIIYWSYRRYLNRAGRKDIELNSPAAYSLQANAEDNDCSPDLLDEQNISYASLVESSFHTETEIIITDRPHVHNMRQLSVEETTSCL